MQIKLIKAYSEYASDLKYHVQNITNNSVTIKIEFINPSHLSLFEELD